MIFCAHNCDNNVQKSRILPNVPDAPEPLLPDSFFHILHSGCIASLGLPCPSLGESGHPSGPPLTTKHHSYYALSWMSSNFPLHWVQTCDQDMGPIAWHLYLREPTMDYFPCILWSAYPFSHLCYAMKPAADLYLCRTRFRLTLQQWSLGDGTRGSHCNDHNMHDTMPFSKHMRCLLQFCHDQSQNKTTSWELRLCKLWGL